MYMQPTYYPNNYQYPTVAGRIVNDFSEIIPNDIPMDGRNAFFVKGDMSEIQSRKWNQDGRIMTIRYKPIFEDNETEKNDPVPKSFENEDISILQDNIEELTKRMDKIEKSIHNRVRVRKEGGNHEQG